MASGGRKGQSGYAPQQLQLRTLAEALHAREVRGRHARPREGGYLRDARAHRNDPRDGLQPLGVVRAAASRSGRGRERRRSVRGHGRRPLQRPRSRRAAPRRCLGPPPPLPATLRVLRGAHLPGVRARARQVRRASEALLHSAHGAGERPLLRVRLRGAREGRGHVAGVCRRELGLDDHHGLLPGAAVRALDGRVHGGGAGAHPRSRKPVQLLPAVGRHRKTLRRSGSELGHGDRSGQGRRRTPARRGRLGHLSRRTHRGRFEESGGSLAGCEDADGQGAGAHQRAAPQRLPGVHV